MNKNALWCNKMDKLLVWMRSKAMPFSFCAEVITREMGILRTKNACVSRYHKLKGK